MRRRAYVILLCFGFWLLIRSSGAFLFWHPVFMNLGSQGDRIFVLATIFMVLVYPVITTDDAYPRVFRDKE